MQWRETLPVRHPREGGDLVEAARDSRLRGNDGDIENDGVLSRPQPIQEQTLEEPRRVAEAALAATGFGAAGSCPILCRAAPGGLPGRAGAGV